MLFEELEERYGPYAAEMIRQALTLEEFEKHEIEELVLYFELKAERTYQEYRARLAAPPPENAPSVSQVEYLKVLRRRWQESEELARLILEVERRASEREIRALGT